MRASSAKVKSKLGWETEEEGVILRLFTVEGKAWKEISATVNSMFPGRKRNAKQCRERYTNFIKFEKELKSVEPWNAEQEKSLLELYMEYGSKWTEISNKFQNRSPNEVKNKFYGSIRRLLRKLNQIIKNSQSKLKLKTNRKQMSYESIFRLLSLEITPTLEKTQQQVEKESFIWNLKHRFLTLLADQESNIMEEEALEIGENISKFNIITRVDRLKELKKSKNPNTNRRKYLPPLYKKAQSDQAQQQSSPQALSPFSQQISSEDPSPSECPQQKIGPTQPNTLNLNLELNLSLNLESKEPQKYELEDYWEKEEINQIDFGLDISQMLNLTLFEGSGSRAVHGHEDRDGEPIGGDSDPTSFLPFYD